MRNLSRLSSEAELAEQFGISRTTVRRALDSLDTRGYLSRQQGLGTFVSTGAGEGFMGGLERLESFRSLAARAGLDATVELREVGLVEAPESIATVLGVEAGTQLTRIQNVEAVNGIRSIYINDYVPANLIKPDDIRSYDGPVLTLIATALDDPHAYTRSEVLAIDAPPDIAELLEVKEGKSLLHFRELHFGRSGKPIGVSRIYVLTDQLSFYIVRRAI